MGDATDCSIEGCAKKRVARGWCGTHYARWRRHGDPLRTLRPTWRQPAEVRFFAKVDASGVCWEWIGFIHPTGYGRFGGGMDCHQAHRWAWLHLVGSIPSGMEPDHLCRNRRCVNPDHMELVSHRVNVLRGAAPTARNAHKTHCPKGHPYAGANLRVYARPGGKPSRYCVTCRSPRKAGRDPTRTNVA